VQLVLAGNPLPWVTLYLSSQQLWGSIPDAAEAVLRRRGPFPNAHRRSSEVTADPLTKLTPLQPGEDQGDDGRSRSEAESAGGGGLQPRASGHPPPVHAYGVRRHYFGKLGVASPPPLLSHPSRWPFPLFQAQGRLLTDEVHLQGMLSAFCCVHGIAHSHMLHITG